jgi:hypothetical protein
VGQNKEVIKMRKINARAKPYSPLLDRISNKLTEKQMTLEEYIENVVKMIPKLKSRRDIIKRMIENMSKCMRGEIIHYCDGCGHEKRTPYTCGNRSCPFCYPIRRYKLKKKYRGYLDGFRRPDLLKFLTLTFKSSKKITKEVKRQYQRDARNFIRRLPREVAGMRALEIVFHEEGEPKLDKSTGKIRGYYEEDVYYYHFHFIIEMLYIPQSRLSELWKDVTGTSSVVDIRKINTKGALNYILKYATKPMNFFDLELYLTVFYKSRFVTKIGYLYNLKIEIIRRGLICPECDSLMVYCGTTWRWVIGNYKRITDRISESFLKVT